MVMDSEARFRAIFHVAYPALGRYVHNRGLWGADADDLVAETLEIAWRRLDQVPEDDPLPWLFAVARNLLRNKRRSEGRRALLLARLAGERADAHAGESATSQEAVLLGALASLRPDDQEILKLVAWDGLSPSQAAVVLGCSPLAPAHAPPPRPQPAGEAPGIRTRGATFVDGSTDIAEQGRCVSRSGGDRWMSSCFVTSC